MDNISELKELKAFFAKEDSDESKNSPAQAMDIPRNFVGKELQDCLAVGSAIAVYENLLFRAEIPLYEAVPNPEDFWVDLEEHEDNYPVLDSIEKNLKTITQLMNAL